MSEVWRSMAEGMAFGRDWREKNLAEQKRSRLAELAQGVFQNDPKATMEAYSLDPNTARAYTQGADRQHQIFKTLALQIKQAPTPDLRARIYAMYAPQLKQILPDAPDQWDESYLPMVDQVIAQAGYLDEGSGAGGNVQSSFVDAQGNRVAIMRDGSIKVLAQNAPNNQIIEGKGGFYGVNKNTLNAAPVTMGGTPQSAPSGLTRLPNGQQVNIDPNMSEYERNLAYQYAPQLEQGGDFQGPPQMIGGGQLQPAQKPRSPSELEQRLAMADKYGATEDDKRQMVLGSNATRGALSQKERRAIALQKAQIPALERRIDNIGTAFEKLSSNFLDGGPLDQYAIGMTQDGQMLEATAAQLKPLLLSFVRVPGIGAQSDLEARLDALQYPSIGNHPSVNRALLAELKQFIGDLKNAYQNTGADVPQEAAPAAAPRRLKFNPATGELE